MRIGVAFDLRPASAPADSPDDAFEEFDSPGTIRAICEALRELGHTVDELGDGRELIEKLLASPYDFVFNFAEGTGSGRSREARVPALCEMLGVPYSGSDPLAMAAALDKDIARRLAQDAGVPVPRAITLGPPRAAYKGDMREFASLLTQAGMDLPVIVKPTSEGSSKGIRDRCLVRTAAELGPAVVELWNAYAQPVLVEEFIGGEEVTVGLVGNAPPAVFGVMTIAPKVPADHFVYSLEVKRDYLARIDYACPAPLDPDLLADIEASAVAVFEALGCRDVARLDFRVREGVAYFIEVNPLPGLNPESSDLVIMARLLGKSHADVVRLIFGAAAARLGLG